ncbi:hypothetical protein HXA34_20260 [Salipaludibacillus agaradhaerens]|uniref:hypothetical protein n=1 Tax=Salipaludibacillus agaradhaerens TaxID=76935 RepID=UPI0021510EB6|nr:hypothetical protein [Salipaludibacillus agaradhaerens]MCR6108629.1 hypothetical protein [Salipaludibacillus agaradhaerens]MCR6120655.1 hypothetical protein [Salipaludibacillus agaradhaerens]
MKQTLNYTCDPLQLVRLVMDMFAEELEGKHTKSIQFARYKYLRTMTDEELTTLLQRYIREQEVIDITLRNWRKDCRYLFQYIYKSERYQALKFEFNKQGYGKTGMGVVDKSDGTFYHCALGQHWSTIMEIINSKYPDLHPAFEAMYVYDNDVHNDVTRKELDSFIINRFELIGENQPLDAYL